jgi:hypothetical protein
MPEPTSNTMPPRPRRRWKQLQLRTRITLLASFLTLLTIGLEIMSRVYWAIGRGVPVLAGARIWHAYYPELANAERVPCVRSAEQYEVLMLGGSTMALAFEELDARLKPALEARTGKKTHITNLASPGRNSLDSRLKYEFLANKCFDLILVYDGFNDTRMNNTKPDTFRADYSHDPRHAELQALARHREVGWLTLPFTAEFTASALSRRFGLTGPTHAKWSPVAEVRSPQSLEANLDAIAHTANNRGETLILMTYSYYIPSSYTDEAFAAGVLDYTEGFGYPLKDWGVPSKVIEAVDKHNEAIRRVAKGHGVQLVDQAALLHAERRHFVDPCHFTRAGNAQFVSNVLDELKLN